MIEHTVDLLRLRNGTLPKLLVALERLLEMGSPAASLGAVSELAVDETVRLVRYGSRSDLLAGGDTLATFLGGPRGARVKTGAPGAYDTLSGLLPVLSAASSPAGRGGEALVLRSWSGKALAALAAVARAGSMPRAELRDDLRVSQSHLSHMLKDLEAAQLLELLLRSSRLSAACVGPEEMTPPAAMLAIVSTWRRSCRVARALGSAAPA
jgi:hypothetical protein